MKKTIIAVAAIGALLAGATSADAADALKLKLKWVPQAQFAGYYVAQSKGYYKDAGLDVTIDAASTDVTPVQALVGGTADVVIDWAADALSSREKGVNLVNIAQPFKNSGLLLTCRKDMGVATTADFKGKTLGVWFGGNEYPFYAFMAKLNLPTNGGADGVTVLKQGFNVDPLLQKQAACISTMTYNEYWQVIDAGVKPADLIVFKYEDEGVATLEDGLYTLDAKLKDPAMVDKLARFVRAAMKGWDYAIKNQPEAVKIVLKNDMTGAQTEHHQTQMMGEIAKLVANQPKGLGYLEEADYQRTVDVLLKGSSDPVITKKPAGAWTHEVWDKAMKK